MRISDWSSDVCSSDLLNAPDHRNRRRQIVEGYSRSADAEVLLHLWRDLNAGAAALLSIFRLKVHVHRRLAGRVVALHRQHRIEPVENGFAGAVLHDAVDELALRGARSCVAIS